VGSQSHDLGSTLTLIVYHTVHVVAFLDKAFYDDCLFAGLEQAAS